MVILLDGCVGVAVLVDIPAWFAAEESTEEGEGFAKESAHHKEDDVDPGPHHQSAREPVNVSAKMTFNLELYNVFPTHCHCNAYKGPISQNTVPLFLSN